MGNEPSTPEVTPTPAPIAEPIPQPSKGALTQAEADQMISWAREDVLAGKLKPEQAEGIYASLRATPEQIAGESEEVKALNVEFGTPAKDSEYMIRYAPPGVEAPRLTAEQQTFDSTARSWLSTAGFPKDLGNTLVTYIDKTSQHTQHMSEGELQEYGHKQYEILQRSHGKELESRLELAGKMISEIEKTRPGIRQLLLSRGIGDSAEVANALILQSRAYFARRKQ